MFFAPRRVQSLRFFLNTVLSVLFICAANTAYAESREALERDSKNALNNLLAQNQIAKDLNARAAAVLVFPSVKKAGLMVGAQYGEGVLWRDGKATAFYNTGGASFGFQAGVQEYGYAMFFMKDNALNALNVTQGFEVGVGPSVVVIDQGMGVSHTTTTMQNDIYAFVFSQKGLMAGVGIQGNKITRINK
jgi:lipid-binding SYLF domain-containing protein